MRGQAGCSQEKPSPPAATEDGPRCWRSSFEREGADVAINYCPSEEPAAKEVFELIREVGRKAVISPDSEHARSTLLRRTKREESTVRSLVQRHALGSVCRTTPRWVFQGQLRVLTGKSWSRLAVAYPEHKPLGISQSAFAPELLLSPLRDGDCRIIMDKNRANPSGCATD